jgi:hypothetical protein
MYLYGSIFYALYFVVSFPMFLRFFTRRCACCDGSPSDGSVAACHPRAEWTRNLALTGRW